MDILLNQLLKKASSVLSPVSETPSLDVEILLAHSIGTTREKLIINPPKTIDAETVSVFSYFVQKRFLGHPVAYLTGKKSFYENDLIVNEYVLIPRPETEQIVEKGIEVLLTHQKPVMLDVGTGSGCIPISVAKYAPHARIIASDISPQALTVARLNAEREGLISAISFLKSDLLASVPHMHFTLITANLPYLPAHEARAVSQRYCEPIEALNGGFLGIELYQRFFQELTTCTFDHLLIECGQNNIRQIAQSARDILPKVGIGMYKDLAGLFRGLEITRINKA